MKLCSRRTPLPKPAVFLAAGLIFNCAAAAYPQDVVVESVERAAEKRKGEAKAGSVARESKDPYAPAVDWRRVPPWRQASFYDVRAQGTFFVFVVDCSGSMADAERWLRVRQEMRRALGKLQFPQRYYVIFYNDEAWRMPGGAPQSAAKREVGRTLDWMSGIVPEGATDPRPAMSEALGLRPDGVFLLSDGEYPKGTAEAIAKSNSGAVPIHCIDLSGGAAGDTLKEIAKASGGQYVTRN
jgi:hypothetical protein